MPVSRTDQEKSVEEHGPVVAAAAGEGVDTSDRQLVPVAAADEDDAREEKVKKENDEKESPETSEKKGSTFMW